ncbi:MAG: selenocysteine synthase [Acidobacteria bacterium]|nr:selenocysteine synthase [Acidobacteriota bacterium]
MNRRKLLMGAGAPLAAALLPRSFYAAQLAAGYGEIYRQLGIRPLINAAGTYTTLTGSLLVPQARDAMSEAAKYFVPLIDLQQAAGARIAKMLEVPAAMVSSGGAGSILLATAACVAGKDPEKIRRLPDTTGMKNEVIMVRAHRMGFDHAARTTGVKIVEVETVEQLKSAISPQTAMLFWVNIKEPLGKVGAREFLEAGKQAGVPVFNDAAAELPPADNLSALVKQGYDLAGFSGGKGLRGPQASGLLLGRKDLIEAAHLNNNPHSDTIARTCKVGKEEIMALVAAVEVYVRRDHAADMKLWHGFMHSIARDLKGIEGLKSEVYVPAYPGAHPVPYLRVTWEQAALPLTCEECARRLREGEPRIEVNAAKDEITLAAYLLNAGEERIVGWRLREVLREAKRA